jgi:D-alanyl-D-alanine carboxypeptidase
LNKFNGNKIVKMILIFLLLGSTNNVMASDLAIINAKTISLAEKNESELDHHKLQKLLDSFRVQSKVPAAVLSINFPNNTITSYVSGTVKKITEKTPNPSAITTDNLFQIGSITKSFTAAIILQLEAEKKLSINNTIFDLTQKYGPWLPIKEYQTWKNISIKQLLNMTSGIPDYVEDKGFMKIIVKHPEKYWTPDEIFKYSIAHKPYFPPGKGWHYSNTDYYILGLLIETVTKHSFEAEINQRILKKYLLNNTYYVSNEYPEYITQRIASGYAYSDGGFFSSINSGTDMTKFNLSAAGPGGALVSNSEDITRWIRLLFTGKILPPYQLNEMLTAVCTDHNKDCLPGESININSHFEGFSLGLARMFDPQLGIIWIYTGSTPGYYSALVWIPTSKIALGLTINATTKGSRKILTTLIKAAKLIS